MSTKKGVETPISTVTETVNDKENYTLAYELNYGEVFAVNPLVDQEAAILKTAFLKELSKEETDKLGIKTDVKVYSSFGSGICHGTDGKGNIIDGGIWVKKEERGDAPDNSYRGISTYTYKMVGTTSAGCKTC